MATRIMTDCQRGGTKTRILSWRFGRRPPYIDRKVHTGHDAHYLFKCKIEGCGSNEFEAMAGGLVECECCREEYVVEWDFSPVPYSIFCREHNYLKGFEGGKPQWADIKPVALGFNRRTEAEEFIKDHGLEDCRAVTNEYCNNRLGSEQKEEDDAQT